MVLNSFVLLFFLRGLDQEVKSEGEQSLKITSIDQFGDYLADTLVNDGCPY